MTDEKIEDLFKACGGFWDGDRWCIEDADLHPFARSLIEANAPQPPAEREPLSPECIQELEHQAYVDGRRPVYRTDCWGDEVVEYEPTKYFNYFLFSRIIERTLAERWGVNLAATQPKQENSK